MRNAFFIICLVFIGLSGGVRVGAPAEAIPVIPASSVHASIEEVAATVSLTAPALWKASRTTLRTKSSLNVLRFSDPNHGWSVSSDASLFKTTDAGRSWKRVAVSLPRHGDIMDVAFVSPSEGWIAIAKVASSLLDSRSNETWLMHTQDEGRTWTTQYNQPSAQLTRMVFLDSKEGWAAGMNTVSVRPIQQVHFVIHTRDGGKTWANVSGPLNEVASGGTSRVQDQATDLMAVGPATLTLLSLRGSIFTTDSGGASWLRVATLPDERETCNCKIGVSQAGGLWVLGGTRGKEGTLGTFASEVNQGSWMRFSAGGIYFTDAVDLGKDHIIVAGSANSTRKPRSSTDSAEEGVILDSSDGGRNWSVVFRSATIPTINRIVAVGPDHIVAAGDMGSIVNLTRITHEH